MLVAVSGTDGSGKGDFTSQLVPRLDDAGLTAVGVTIDGWLALPDVRFSVDDPGGNISRRGLRLDEMFERLVLPLKTGADIVREYETVYFPAQRLHFELDRPRESADLIVTNDPRLEGPDHPHRGRFLRCRRTRRRFHEPAASRPADDCG
jgi:hypothetical protein